MFKMTIKTRNDGRIREIPNYDYATIGSHIESPITLEAMNLFTG